MQGNRAQAMLRHNVLTDVDLERDTQENKWGTQRHNLDVWLTILVEEIGEVAQAIQGDKHWGKDTDSDDTYSELIQVAAVAAAMAEQLEELRLRSRSPAFRSMQAGPDEGEQLTIDDCEALSNVFYRKGSDQVWRRSDD